MTALGQEVEQTESIHEDEQAESRKDLVKVGKVSKYIQDPLSRLGATFKVRSWLYGTYKQNMSRRKFFAKVHKQGDKNENLKENETFIANGWVYRVYDTRSRGRIFVKILGIQMKEAA